MKKNKNMLCYNKKVEFHMMIVESIKAIVVICLICFMFVGIAVFATIICNDVEDNKFNINKYHIEKVIPLKAPKLDAPIQYVNVSNVYNHNKEQNIEDIYINGWVKNDTIYIYTEPSFSSSISGVLTYNEVIEFTPIKETKEWVKIKFMDVTGYVLISNLSLEKNSYVDFEIPTYSGFKSYMDYRTVTVPTSAQYNLLNTYGYSDGGFRKVNDRYCIAIGSYFNTSIGQYIDLILENGIVIKCIMGDLKADIHTENNNIFTSANKCCSEFIVDLNTLDPYVAKTGNISKNNPSWDSPVKYIRVYNENVFDK